MTATQPIGEYPERPLEYPEPIGRVGTYRMVDGKKEYIKGGPLDSNIATYTDEQIEEIKELAQLTGVIEGQEEGYNEGIIEGTFQGQNDTIKKFMKLKWWQRLFFSTDYLWESYEGQNDNMIEIEREKYAED